MSPDDVTALIVTRGDVDVEPVVSSLIFDDVLVWNNSTGPDLGTYGIVAACMLARNQVVFSIDDDIIHSEANQVAILAQYETGVITGCMWPEWSAGARAQGIPGGYDDLVFYGSGAVYDKNLPQKAAERYSRSFPMDAFFRLWFSCIFGVLTPSRQLDLRFEELPWASGPTRMADIPDGPAQKRDAIMRARGIRDRAAA